MMGLVDFLKAAGIEVNTNSLKIHLACWNGREDPIDEFFKGTFKAWQEWQAHRNFQCDQVLSLVDLGQSDWLFVGLYAILSVQPHPENPKHFLYSTSLLPNQDALIGRITVHHKRSRASYIWYKADIPLTITEIRREKLTIGEFPGYNAVALPHSRLKIVIEQQIPSWHHALINIKGIYLITDSSSGKHYVGKASGNDGIWNRWCEYADNGHGGNVQLKKLLKDHGPTHMQHFQYSILEIADTHASEADILKRESHWMDVLKSREFGLN